ncbi:MAG: hypothetical protein QNJ47_25450 [Nostocaceae cyanobacterium]|nr:hypothetical protein [Nostocaceae cyanobacterium]
MTQIDKVRQREQADLLNNLRSRLSEQLGIQSPVLYPCSAQVILDEITGEEPVPSHLMVWTEKFRELENSVFSRLSKERSLSIAENVLRVLTRLFEQLDGHLQTQWEEYKQRQIAIEREVIPDLASFTASEEKICQGMLEDAISTTTAKVNLLVQKYREETISRIRTKIFNADDETELERIVNSDAEEILKQAQQDLQVELQRKTEHISQIARKASNQFDQKFAEAYNKLQTLTAKVEIQNTTNNSISINTSSVFTSMQSLNEEIDTQEDYYAWGGAAAGAAIGSAIIPVFGTVVGGVIGFVASLGFFASLDNRKQKLWEKLYPSLSSYFETVKIQARQATENHGRIVQNALQQRIETYMLHYQETVDQILAEQKAELQRLNHLQATITTDLQEIERRRKTLEAQQKKLIDRLV